jgi:hypothetical protein
MFIPRGDWGIEKSNLTGGLQVAQLNRRNFGCIPYKALSQSVRGQEGALRLQLQAEYGWHDTRQYAVIQNLGVTYYFQSLDGNRVQHQHSYCNFERV